MKALNNIKKAVTIITLVLLTVDMFTHINLFPYALLSFSLYCFIKCKEFYDSDNKSKAALSAIGGIIAVIVIIFLIVR